MNRLWVRFSLMIGGVLFLVFFLQFLSIMAPRLAGSEDRPPLNRSGPGPDRAEPDSEITWRLFEWMGFSLLVGLVGGVVLGRRVSAPISDLASAARRISEGDLDARVLERGSQELIDLAVAFNKMAADLQHTEVLRRNLMADVSHELRTPLTVLEGSLRAALDHVYALDETEIANLYGQTRHLIRLVNDLRELALAESHQLPLEKQPTDLHALVAETLQALEPLASDRGVRLTAETTDLPEVVVDGTRIRQVLFNLLSNALRHTPSGGTVVVRGAASEREVRLDVQDSGEGLEPAQLSAVFDRFYRADKSRSRGTGGTGLGLAIVKALVETHSGRVAAYSEGKGRGSTFSVTLPR